jgi:hypothetical protein
MAQFKHDEFSKSYLTELLSRIGKAVPNKIIKSESREADLWFEPNPKADSRRGELGLLGQLMTRSCLIEVFRNPASVVEIRACLGKLFDDLRSVEDHREAEVLRQAKRRNKTVAEDALPYLWLIMPTASEEVRGSFGVVATEVPGVYEFPKGYRTGLIVVHQLARTEETLWLRILGREGNQRQTIEEFVQQPVTNELRASIEELLTDYRAKLEDLGQRLTEEEEELIMNLSAAYVKKQQEWLEVGKQEGIEIGEQRGVRQNQQTVAIAALREGLDVSLIMKLTGLSIEEIEQLRHSLG